MQLGSSAFANDATIPRRFTCDGEDLSPPLDWTGTPAETHSLVLLCDDPDAPAGTWHHWAAYDIATDRAGLPEGATRHADRQGFKQAVNDFLSRDNLDEKTLSFIVALQLSPIGLRRSLPTSRPRPSPLSLPAARAFNRPPAAAQRSVLP
jgi:Raf kinase inhibitor-like YbhB/YbcL family protein